MSVLDLTFAGILLLVLRQQPCRALRRQTHATPVRIRGIPLGRRGNPGVSTRYSKQRRGAEGAHMHGLQQPCTGPLACSHGVGVLEFLLRLQQLLGPGVDPVRLSLQLVELGLLCAR